MRQHFLTFCAIAAVMTPAAALAQPRRIVLQGVIDEPGRYMLSTDIRVGSSPGVGILITASGVDLDLSGASISGPGGIQGTAIHVRNAAGVTIRNGKFANLQLGITVEDRANVTIRDCQFRGEGLIPAAMPETALMILQSRNVVVEGNSIYSTGLGICVRGGRSFGNRISNNTITGGMGFAALGICYNPAPGDPLGPRGDLISNTLTTNYPTSIQMNPTSAANVITGNTLVFLVEGVTTKSTNTDMDNVKSKLP